MNSIMTVCLVLGAGVAAVLIAWGLSNISAPQFDERQRMVSGRAYRFALFTLVIYQVIYAIVEMQMGELPMEKPLGQLFGLFLTAGVFTVYRVRYDAFFTRRQHPWIWVWTSGAIVMIATAVSVYVCHAFGFVREGKVTLVSLIPIMGAFYLTQWVAIVFKLLRERRGEGGA